MLTGFDGNMGIQPRGVVTYPDNNSKWRAYAYYTNGAASQSGAKVDYHGVCPGSHSHLRYYTIRKHSGDNILVAAPRTLSKKSRNPVYDTSSWKEIGYLNRELLRDASGAVRAKPDSSGEFSLIAGRMRDLYALPKSLLAPFENVHDDLKAGGSEEDTRENFFEAIESVPESGLEFFAYAGHGTPSSLPSAQVGKSHMSKLADEIRRMVRPDGIVMFYACSTGKPAGFASQISKLLPGMRVWGHTDSGQASRNADKVCYRNGASTDIRSVLSKTAKEKWARYLLHNPDFYARFPFMALETIEAELENAVLPPKK
jgi:hypothetical protein